MFPVEYVDFPRLGLYLPIRAGFSFFGMSIHFYGVIIALGLILALIVTFRIAKKNNIGEETILDVVLWGFPAAIVCARLYYVIFNWSQYASDPVSIFKIWEGGIAIYGAILGALFSTFLYCRIKKVSFSKVVDTCSIGLLIGQAIGRWGNFVNQEAFGGNTNAVWGMTSERIRTELSRLQAQGYPVDPAIPVHPTFLYESLWNLAGIILIMILKKYKKFDGEIFLFYVVWYGLGRGLIEGLRTDSLMAGPFRVSQVLAFVSAIIGTIIIVYMRKKQKKHTVKS